jgi:hypothetical protein
MVPTPHRACGDANANPERSENDLNANKQEKKGRKGVNGDPIRSDFFCSIPPLNLSHPSSLAKHLAFIKTFAWSLANDLLN